MAHFAKLQGNKVVQVIVVGNKDCLDENGNESESVGVSFCKSLFGGEWVQTSYNNNFRVRFAYPDYTYDETLDAFIPPKPYPSWVLNETTVDWEAPVEKPDDGQEYTWNEETQSWNLVPTE
jgi:hypothetical protein